MTALSIGIKGIGLAAPGLPNWPDGKTILRGQQPYMPEDMTRYAPTLLPPNEQRRATAVGRLAFQSAEEAIKAINGEASKLASVFASSGGDTHIVNNICMALATDDRRVSPTHFHNSVHNAAAGYWSIATKSHAASSSLSAYDGSFAAGLIEAATLALCENVDVLLVAYDVQVLAPLDVKRPVHQSFTTAFILTPDSSQGLGRMELRLRDSGVESIMDDADLEALRKSNPAARALPVLAAIAKGGSADITLPALDHLFVEMHLEA